MLQYIRRMAQHFGFSAPASSKFVYSCHGAREAADMAWHCTGLAEQAAKQAMEWGSKMATRAFCSLGISRESAIRKQHKKI